MITYRDRLVKAIAGMELLIREREPDPAAMYEIKRLSGKKEGLQLALSYYDEEVRNG